MRQSISQRLGGVTLSLMILLVGCGDGFRSQDASYPALTRTSGSFPLPAPMPGPTPTTQPNPGPMPSPSPVPMPTPLPATGGARAILPLRLVDVGNGQSRYTVTLQIGQTTLDAIVDTGSTGIRVLDSALRSSDFSDENTAISVTFGGSRQVSGTIGHASISLDGVALGGQTEFEIVKNVTCTDGSSACTAFAGNFTALVGIGLRGNALVNPLTQMGGGTWIFEGAFPGQSGTQIVLNPTSAELSGFFNMNLLVQTQGNVRLWDDKGLAMCLINQDTHASFCAPTLMDSGGGNQVHLGGGGASSPWSNGTHATLAFTNQQNQTFTYGFVIGNSSGMAANLPSVLPSGAILNTGLLPFFAFQVMYNSGTGIIGIKAR